jgi:mono/diheme cytochrome c family protein
MRARTRPDPAILVRAAVVALVVALVAGSAVGWRTARAEGAPIDAGAPRADTGAADAAAAAARAGAIYAFSCAVCHGATGRGFAEAVMAFPDDYRDCARCHHPQNAPQMPGSEIMGSVMAFSLGDPPPLAEPERLARFGTAAGLLGYVRATMPRWSPGRLDDEAYLDVTAHLLRMVGWLGDDESLTEARLSRPLGVP